MAGALSGVVIADFSRVLAGPYATMLLGDLDAEVIKVERPVSGDDTRAWGPPYGPDGQATYFTGVNRNKKSVFLDLASSAGTARAHDLAARADVLVENFSPGTMDRLGLGYSAVTAGNPDVIYCSITGFGSAEGAKLPGYDLLVQAMGGLMSITGHSPAEPTKVGVALVDVIAGLHACYGILAALHHRDATGEGQHIEINLLSSLLSALVNQSSAYVGAGVVPRGMGNEHPSISPYAVYAAADGPLVLAVGNDRQFAALVLTLGAPLLAGDARFATNPARVAHRIELRTELESLLRKHRVAEWVERLMAVGVPCGPINDIAAAFSLAGELGLAPIVEIPVVGDPNRTEHRSRQVANPVRFSATPPTYRLPPPALPHHDR